MNPVGQAAEDRALAFLQQQGLRLVTRNWSCKAGEIDLIMRDGDTWVFIEVRHRASHRFGSAADSITASKRRKLEHSAQLYLANHSINAPCRFDAALSTGDGPVQWLKNIFI